MIQKRRRSMKARIPRQGNFHMALPQILKLRLPALDTTLHGIGLGRIEISGASPSAVTGARTRTATFYDLFFPRGSYLLDTKTTPVGRTRGAGDFSSLSSPQTTGLDNSWLIPGSYDPLNPSQQSEETRLNLIPGQFQSFAALYKLARVERVDFNFRFTNLGVSSIIGSADVATALSQNTGSSSVNHLLTVLPKSQWATVFDLNTSNGLNWSPDSKHSSSNAAQMAELPGSTFTTTSQDGNREIVTVKKSFDCAARMGGDPIRTTTWMTSLDDGSGWTLPTGQPTDPQLGVIGTSTLIDQILISGNPSMTTGSGGSFWFRYNEHVHVYYHITFWEPKTPQLAFS